MEEGCILEICSQVGRWAFLGYLSFVQIPNFFSPFLLFFLKLAFLDQNVCTMFSPRPVSLRILITLQDDSLESVVDACLILFWHIYREGGDQLDFVKILAHAKNFQLHFFPRYQ